MTYNDFIITDIIDEIDVYSQMVKQNTSIWADKENIHKIRYMQTVFLLCSILKDHYMQN